MIDKTDTVQDESAANDLVTAKCDCAKGAQHRAELEKQNRRQQNIEYVNGDGYSKLESCCSSFGVELSQHIKERIINTANDIMDGAMIKAKYVFGGTSKITVSLSENMEGELFLDYSFHDSQRQKI